MKPTGMVAWGNGEPCPFCQRTDISDDDHMDHLMTEHKAELKNALFNEWEAEEKINDPQAT